MGAQSSAEAAEAQGDAPQSSSMRPGWPQGQPPDMVWGSDRGLRETLEVCACKRVHTHTHTRTSERCAARRTPQHWSLVTGACRRSLVGCGMHAHGCMPTRLTDPTRLTHTCMALLARPYSPDPTRLTLLDCPYSTDPTRLPLLALQGGSVDDLDAALLEAVADGDAEATADLL